jgi:hypothetical protein
MLRLCYRREYEWQIKSDSRLIQNVGHFSAAIGTSLASLDAFVHTADLFAIRRACLTDFGADFAKRIRKLRTAELKVSRHTAYLGAIHHQTEVLCLDMLATGIETVVHRGFQADLIAVGASFYTDLHGMFLHGMFVQSAFLHGLLSIHGILLN